MINVNIIPGGSVAYDALLYPERNPMNQQYFQRNLEMLNDHIGVINEAFVNTAKTAYEAFNDSSVAQIAKAALNKAKGVLRPDVITELNVDTLHSASPLMQRWIMAEPTIRDLYINQECDGYSDTYFDIYPDVIKEDHYDYRRVMDGVIEIDDDKDAWSITFYTEDIINSKDELSPDKKLDILNTWDNVRLAIARGIDPTDPYQGEL
jgi:hypothetical protein